MQIDLNKDIPPKFQNLLFNDDRFLILKGSAGSGKSVTVSKKLVFRSIYEDNHKHLVMRKIQRTIKESIFEEIKKRISEWGLRNRVYYHVNNSELKIYLKDSQFIFMGMDDPEKLKSISGITSLTMEELTEFTENDFDQANLRLRGETKFYKQTIGMFNPISEDHWVKKRFFDSVHNLPTTIHESTYLDNPFLDAEYKQLLESYKETNNLYYQIYCLGEWGIVDKSNKFLYAFDQENHVGTSEIDSTIRISFDFNIDPFCAVVYSRTGHTLYFYDFISLANSDIYQVCDHIKAKYPDSFFIVTGDSSGNNRTGTARGKDSYWRIIKRELNLKDQQIRLRGKNLGLIESRILCNSALQHRDIKIDKSLNQLIKECKFAKVDESGILIKDRKDNKLDQFDAWRYAIDIEFPELIRNPKRK